MAAIAAAVAWGLLLPAMPVVGALFFVSVGSAKSAIQEASVAAMFATILLGLYIAVRCVGMVAAAADRFAARSHRGRA